MLLCIHAEKLRLEEFNVANCVFERDYAEFQRHRKAVDASKEFISE
jgi:hypothetical protein